MCVDLVISGANCYVCKFRCRHATVLKKKRKRSQTNTYIDSHKPSRTHAHTNYFWSQLRGGAADFEKGNMKDYSFLKILHSCNKALIHLVRSFRLWHSEENLYLTLNSFQGRKIRSLIKSKINDKISLLLQVQFQLGKQLRHSLKWKTACYTAR